MQLGYLSIETSLSHPGLIRLIATTTQPPDTSSHDGPAADPAIRYVARFHDLDAARMHAFAALKSHVVDLENDLYRADVTEAIAVLEGMDLRHERLFLDPDLQSRAGTEIARRVARIRHRQQVIDRIWTTLGVIAFLWMLLWALAPVLG
jgi:hypothetical protein